jgi:flagellar protein FliO/FliZ|tara:strand:- start:249 stop:674 length:426 start_codon:yes stop_codon:yes gene_type:complete
MKMLMLSLWLLPLTLFAEQSGASKTTSIEPMSSSYLLKLTGGLILVVVVIFVLAWLIKKMNLTPQSQTGLIKVIAGLNLGTRERVVLLEVGGEQILVGLCSGRMDKLHTLTKAVGADALAPESTQNVQSKFSQLLARVGKK